MYKPLVSAVIPTKDRAGLLKRALRSVRDQTYPNMEVIVVDDGSSDATAEVVERFQSDMMVRYLRFDRSRGASKARNEGIHFAEGEFIAGLDDDDEWHPERVSRLMEAYSDEYAFACSDVRLIYEKRTVVWHKKKVITYEELLYSNQVGNQVLARRERLEAVGGFDESLAAAQDYDLWLRLAERYGSAINVQEPLQNIYADHEGEQITKPGTQLAGYLDFYKKHKHLMNRAQRKYQLFNIRRAQQKVAGPLELLRWVPRPWLWKELKRYVAEMLLGIGK